MSSRLVEVWCEGASGSGYCGSGWRLGDRAVLTAKHVVADPSMIQVRSADASTPTAWVKASVHWAHPTLDAALLEIANPEDQPLASLDGPIQKLVAVGSQAAVADAIGFPDAATRPDGLRDTEHVRGTLLPGSGARDPGKVIALDVDNSVPEDAILWEGFSGSAVLDEHERLLGIVVKVDPTRQNRRLLVMPVQDFASEEGFELAATTLELRPVVESPNALSWRAAIVPGSLTPEGEPIRVSEIDNLGVFGVHAAVVEDTGSAYPKYLARPAVDSQIDRALAEAAQGGQRLVALIGDSASGKSRSLAEGILRNPSLAERKIVIPRRDGGLPRLINQGSPLDEMLLWLDDIDKYVADTDPEVFLGLLEDNRDLVIAATIRRSQLQDRDDTLTDPVWQLLTDDRTNRLDLSAVWSESEVATAEAEFSSPGLLAALAKGIGLGEYLIGGPSLVKRLTVMSELDKHVVEVVVGWYRTGLQQPIPADELRDLWTVTLPESTAAFWHSLPSDEQDTRFASACARASKPLFSRDAYDVAVIRHLREGYEANDYVVDHISRQDDRPPIPIPIWEAALRPSPGQASDGNGSIPTERLWQVGMAAYREKALEFSLSLMRTLADARDAAAAFNVAVILRELDRRDEAETAYAEVVSRYGESSEFGTRAQIGLGSLLKDRGDIDAAKVAYERAVAYGAVAHQSTTITALGIFLKEEGDMQGAAATFEHLIALDDAEAASQGIGLLGSVGTQLKEAGDLQGAAAIFQRMIDASDPEWKPRGIALLASIGTELKQAEKPDQAAEIFERIINSGDPEWKSRGIALLGSTGQQLMEAKDWDGAAEIFQRVIDSGDPDWTPRGIAVLANVGIQLKEAGELDRAAEIFERVINIGDPEWKSRGIALLGSIGTELQEAGDLRGAANIFERVIDSGDPDWKAQGGALLANVGMKLTEAGELDEAELIAERLVNSDDPDERSKGIAVLGSIGTQLRDTGNLDGAATMFERIVDSGDPEWKPKGLGVLAGVGIKLKEAGELGRAVAIFERVIDSGDPDWKPRGVVLLANVGLEMQEKGDLMGAAAAYEGVVDHGDPEWSARGLAFLAAVGIKLRESGDKPRAASVFRGVVDRGDPEWSPRAAALLAELGC